MMFTNFKVFIGILIIVSGGFVFYLQLSSTNGIVLLTATSAFDGAEEVLQLENIIRNITNATVEQIGTVYADCKSKDTKLGLLLLRELSNHTKEVWLILQLHPERAVQSGLINVKVFYNAHKLFTTHFDLCKQLLPSIKCPILPQRQTFALRYPLRYVWSGKYSIEAWAVDQKDQTLACIKLEYTL